MTQALVDIAYRGSVYALLAFGFVLTYGVSGSFNLAYPIAAVTGALVAARLLATGHPLFVAVIAGVTAGAAAGVIVDRIAVWPTRLRPAGALGANKPLAAGAALAVLFASTYAWYRGPAAGPGAVAALWGSLRLGGVVLNREEAIGAAVCVAALCAGWLVLRRTRLGLGMRAVAVDAAAASAVGVSAELVIGQTVAFASALGALAGISVQLVGGEALPPEEMFGICVAVLAAVLLGGLDSLWGSVAAAYAVAAVQIAVDARFGTHGIPDDGPAVFAAVALIALVLFPAGMFRPRPSCTREPA